MRWNELPEDAAKWATAHASPRFKVPVVESGIRVKGVRGKRPTKPGEVGHIAGNGVHGFSGKRYSQRNITNITTVKLPDGQLYDKKAKTVYGFRRKMAGGILMSLTPSQLKAPDPIADKKKNISKKGKRRRTQKKLRKEFNKMVLAGRLAKLRERSF